MNRCFFTTFVAKSNEQHATTINNSFCDVRMDGTSTGPATNVARD